MKISIAIVACMVAVVIFTMPQVGEAKLGLALAPFVWAANLAKDAARTLIAYKLSLATKALTMITDNRGIRAVISYDSQLEHYDDVAAAAVDDDEDRGGLKGAVASLNPAHDENEGLPSVTKPEIDLSTLPPMPKVVAPQMRKSVLTKLVVPKVVVSKIVKSKADLLSSKLVSKSPAILGGPKNANGYINGGFRTGHGTDPVVDALLGSDARTTPSSPVDPRYVTIMYKSEQLELNETTDKAPVNHSRSIRSVDSDVVGRYFRFIQSNDQGRCVALMVCSMAAHPQEFGAYGRKVVDFFDDVKPSALSPVAPYKEASRIGRSGDSCRSRYSACQVDPKSLAQLGESHVVYT